ncbi:MAG: hypothetical protein KDD37_02180, partial [Bdellovibrionales bacterium]|nr:hypothetical protein [Bdellovibrionales bacterium]
FLVTILCLFSATVFAKPSKNAESIRLANVLLDNPAVAAELSEANVNIIDYSVAEEGVGGQYKYTLQVDRTCFCAPKPGTLIIHQDLRPSYADGAIKYSYELKWADQ